MRWLALVLLIYLFPVLTQPHSSGGFLWSSAQADDDDDGGDDDGGDDDGGADDGGDDDGGDDDGGNGDGGDDDQGGSGSEADGGRDPFGIFNSLFGNDGPPFIENEIVGIALDDLDIAALELVGFRLAEDVDLNALGLSLARLSVPAGLDTAGALALARATRLGATFDFNHVYGNSGDLCGGDQCWSVHLVGLETPVLASCTAGRSIAIVDTAVNSEHTALVDSRVEQRTFRPEGSQAGRPDHGTAIAALLVGRASGQFAALTPNARLLAAEVFYLRDDKVISDALAILRAVDWAIASGAEVIALSLSGQANAALERGLREASRYAALVAAAGNGGATGEPAYPAAYPEVLAVTAIDARKRPYRNANRGQYIDIAAPGVDIWSTDVNGGFTSWTGTSFSVPFVAAALLYAGALTGDRDKARIRLLNSAEDLGAAGRDDVFGWGLLRMPAEGCD